MLSRTRESYEYRQFDRAEADLETLMPSFRNNLRERERDRAVLIGRPACPWVVISVIALALVAFASGTAAVGDDPLEWRPPSNKVDFRKLLSDADYVRRSASILNRLPQARKESATKLPDHGLKISGVFAPGELEAQGVTLGDVITAVDGQELWGRYSGPGSEPIRVQFYATRLNQFREIKVAVDLGPAFSSIAGLISRICGARVAMRRGMRTHSSVLSQRHRIPI